MKQSELILSQSLRCIIEQTYIGPICILPVFPVAAKLHAFETDIYCVWSHLSISM